MVRRSKIAGIDLFAGAGGFSLAVQDAGIDPRLSVELDPVCCETLRANSLGARHQVLEADVRCLSGKELRRMSSIKRGDALIVVGGPPCQPFSKASYWTDPGNDSAYRRKRARGQSATKPKPITRPKQDGRRSLLSEFARLVIEANATAFVLENVRSLLHPRNVRTFEKLLAKFAAAGYQCKVVKADARNYGVPQKRQRVFVLGSLSRIPTPPSFTHRAHKGDPIELPDSECVGPAIARYRGKRYVEDGEEVRGRWSEELREIPPGWNYKYLSEWAGHPNPRFEAETRFWNFLLKLKPDAPSWTVNANPGPWVGPFHWDNRRLRTPELAAIQTFPDGYTFAGNRRERVRQIGNAVPARMAAVMISAVVDSAIA